MIVQFITLDPGHFHAALVQKEMYPDVAPKVHVYAPLGPDLLAHLNRILGFNTRTANPTHWDLEVHTGADCLERLIKDRAGNVVVLSGRNRSKIDYIQAAIGAGLNVLADKPWIISSADLPKLEAVLNDADARGLVAYDIMTERFEITSILQRELVQDTELFGTPEPGSTTEPGVMMESVHYLRKTVAGSPLRRPPWFFDIAQQGEGLSDVGTHLVDLVSWVLFPEQAIGSQEVHLNSGRRWATELTRGQYGEVTGDPDFPAYLGSAVQAGRLPFYCNNFVAYTLRGIQVQLNVLWDYEAPAGRSDTHLAIFRGSRSRVEVRQTAAENYRPELYVVPANPVDHAAIGTALRAKIGQLEKRFPGLTVEDLGSQFTVGIPDVYRVGHEAHFAQVTLQFLRYMQDRRLLPAWEKPNMLAKYFVTTGGVELGR